MNKNKEFFQLPNKISKILIIPVLALYVLEILFCGANFVLVWDNMDVSVFDIKGLPL
jgi:hypothetical protein